MSKKVYREIAKKFGVSVGEVENEIRKMLEEALAQRIARKTVAPSTDELDYELIKLPTL